MSHRSRRLASTTCGGQCNKAIKEKEDESIQCNKCQLWYHQKCTDIPMEAMKYFELVKGIRWFCDSCTNPVKVLLDNGDSNKEITKVVESISELKNEIVDIKAKLNYVSRENEPKIEPPRDSTSLSNEIRISGIPELQKIDNNQRSIKPSGDEIVSYECKQIETVLKQLDEPSSCITNIRRLGRFDNTKKRPRTILLTVDNAWTARKILARAPMLKDFQLDGNAIFISKSLSIVDQEKERKLLLKRRELIESGHDRKNIKIRNQTLLLNNTEVQIN